MDKETNLNSGIPDERGLDAVGRESLLRALAPREDNVVGNLADLQRAGAAVVSSKGSADFAEGVEPPPDVDPDNAAFPASAEEKRTQVIDALTAENEAAKAEATDTKSSSKSSKSDK